jgi:hypothetical protein
MARKGTVPFRFTVATRVGEIGTAHVRFALVPRRSRRRLGAEPKRNRPLIVHRRWLGAEPKRNRPLLWHEP